jgi:hypothetical protein
LGPRRQVRDAQSTPAEPDLDRVGERVVALEEGDGHPVRRGARRGAAHLDLRLQLEVVDVNELSEEHARPVVVHGRRHDDALVGLIPHRRPVELPVVPDRIHGEILIDEDLRGGGAGKHRQSRQR